MFRRPFRVKSAIRSFRDLEVYQKTVELATDAHNLVFPEHYKTTTASSHAKLIENAEKVPKFIAESYGDKFENIALSLQKLERAQRIIADIITQIDILRSLLANDAGKEALDKLLIKYQGQKRKILNLQRAWRKVFVR